MELSHIKYKWTNCLDNTLYKMKKIIDKLTRIKHDKLLHFFYGTIASFIGVGIFGLHGLWFTVVIGAWKELIYDKQHGIPDVWDFVWTIITPIMFIILYNL
jgi:hypothetical protein